MFSYDKFLTSRIETELSLLKKEMEKNSDLAKIQPIILESVKSLRTAIIQKLGSMMDDGLSKEELSEMFFEETDIITDLYRETEQKLKRPLTQAEESLIKQISKMFENILSELWIQF